MTISSSNNVLQQYLLSVNSSEQHKKSKRAKPSEKVKAVKPLIVASDDVASDEKVYEFIHTHAKQLDDVLSQLTVGQIDMLCQIVLESKATYIAYTELVHALCVQLGRHALAIKYELDKLVDLNLIMLHEHAWQGKLLKINPLALSKLLKEYHAQHSSKINLHDMPYTQCELPFNVTIIPFERQLLFFMYEIKRMTIQSNQIIKKVQMSDLRSKFISINALLSSLEQPLFQHATSILDEQQLISCEDGIVRFLLYIAKELNFIELDNNTMIWKETNWLSWLNMKHEEQVRMLQLLISQYLEQVMKPEDYFRLISLLFLPQPHHWSAVEEEQAELPILHFVYGCGWIDVVKYNHEMHIKQTEGIVVDKKSMPIVLPQMQIMCLPDCDSIALWHLIPLAKTGVLSEVIRLEITIHSLQNAFILGYSQQQVEQAIAIESNPSLKAQLARLIAIAIQQENSPKSNVEDLEVKKRENITAPPLLRGMNNIDKLIRQMTDSKLKFIKKDIEYIETRLASFSARWYSALQQYNVSTKSLIVQNAIENGISLEIESAQKLMSVIPLSIKKSSDDYIVDYRVNEINNHQQTLVDSLLLSAITKLRLCR